MEKKHVDVLQESFDNSLSLLDSLNEGVEICELILNDKGEAVDYILHDCNQVFEKMVNRSRKKIMGKRATKFLPSLVKPEYLSYFEKVVKSKKILGFEEYGESIDTWFGITILPLKKDNWFATITKNITRSRKAEITLKESKEKYQALIETTSDFIWEMDTQGRFTYCSPQMKKIWGLKPQDMIGKTLLEIMPMQSRQEISKIFLENIASPKPINGLEISTFDYKGHVVFTEVNGVPFFNDKGKLLGWRGITRDITERKKSQEKLKQSEQHLRLHTRNSPLAVIDWDSNFIVTRWSGQAEKMFGWTSKEVIGKHIMDLNLIYEPDIPLVKVTMRKLTSGNTQVISANRNVTKNGKILYCTWYNSVLLDEKGKMASVMSLVEDNTARIEAEDALKRSEKHYRQLFNSMTEMFEVIEPIYDKENKLVDFVICEVNPALEQFYNKTRDELIGKRAKDFLGISEENWFYFDEVTKTGNPLHLENHRGFFGKYYDIHAWRLKKNQIALLISDVTERKQLEQKLEEYTKNLEDLVEQRTRQLKDNERLAAIGATAGMVGHDIRNPLQAIVGDIYLTRLEVSNMHKGKLRQNIQEYLEAIDENIAYINKIVSDLQDYAKPLVPVIREIKVDSLIVACVQSEKVPKKIKTFYRIANNAKKIFTDEDLLKRILNNLILNAIQAMPDGGKILVDAHKDNGAVIIAIRDTGIGIPDHVKPKLFAPMVTTKAKGQGFGLAAVKRMTEALGGTVSFESEVGKGTKFTVRLPQPN